MEMIVTIRNKIAKYEGNQHNVSDDWLAHIRDQIAKNEGMIPYVCGNSDYTILFDFDDEWAAYETKTARFISDDKSYIDYVFTGNECHVPVITDTIAIRVGVFAGDLHTTTPAYIPAAKSILCESGFPADPAPDVYAQIMEKLNEMELPTLTMTGVDADGVTHTYTIYGS